MEEINYKKSQESQIEYEPIDGIPFSKELGLSRRDLGWIKEVKEASMEQIGAEIEGLRKEGQNPLTRNIRTIKAWDLILVHLMMLRDLKKYGPEIISHQTEKKLDEILTTIFSGFRFEDLGDPEDREKSLKELEAGRDARDYLFTSKIIRCVGDYQNTKDAKDKAAILSRVLNIWHWGGSNAVLGEIIGGLPVRNDAPFNHQLRYFLERLNNLGRD